MKHHSKLFHGALTIYGFWNKALIEAGIAAIPRRTRLGLLRELRDVVESKSEISQALRSEVQYYFGSSGLRKFFHRNSTARSFGPKEALPVAETEFRSVRARVYGRAA
jgi:hypothetical protein